uniref:hypothetical protein n=1 Tax=Agathobacter sp. TaxID=2021311 RepID=UPI00405661D0
MKKLAALLIAGMMAFGCVACGNAGQAGKDTEQNSQAAKAEIADANEILTKAWEEYNAKAGEDLKFKIGGGNLETMVMDEPAKFDVTAAGAKEALTYSYCIPAETIAMTDDVATMVNMMMANNFSAAAYHVAEAANVQTVTDSIKDATLNNQWMCGFPETLIIVTVGEDYVVSAFGNGQVIETFKTAITTVYGDAADVTVEVSLTE